MEIFEIYCKIQNRLIFIMRIKTFFCLWGKKKKETLELKLPQHGRSVPGCVGKIRDAGNSDRLCNMLQDTQNHIGKAESSYSVG